MPRLNLSYSDTQRTAQWVTDVFAEVKLTGDISCTQVTKNKFEKQALRKSKFVNVLHGFLSPEHLPSFQIYTLSSWQIFSGLGTNWRQCEIVLPGAFSTLLLFIGHCSSRAKLSGSITRNTCCLTQIANILQFGSDCSWSTHVTSFSNHCPSLGKKSSVVTPRRNRTD